ncbi:MAG: sensor histidine kinase [Nitrospinota bacterium]
MPQSFFRMRTWLFVAFMALSAIPVFILAAWVEQSAVTKEMESVREKHLGIAKNLSSALSRYVKDVESGFKLIAYNLFERKEINISRDFLAGLHIAGIFIVDADNRFVSESKPNSNKFFSDMPAELLVTLRKAASAQDGKVAFSDIARCGGKPAFFLGLALPRGNLAVGVLWPNYIIEMQKAISFGKDGHSMIVDRKGRVVAHPNKEWQEASQDASKISPVQAMMRGETGVSIFYSPPKQADMIAGHTVVPEVGWGVMVPQPIAELHARARQVKGVALGITFAGMLIAGLISWWLSKFLSSPIELVRNAAARIAEGHLDARVGALSAKAPVELRDLTCAFNRMGDQLVAANRAKEAFLAVMSHELRTPLNHMLGFCQVIERRAKDAEMLKYLSRIMGSGKYLGGLIDGLLDFSRMRTGKFDLALQECSINDLIASLVERRLLEPPGGISIEHAFDPACGRVTCDPRCIGQVFDNLVDNAIKFSPGGGTIRLRTHARRGEVWISVQDEGIGIEEGDLALIFERFRQGEKNYLTRKFGGMGIGLSLAKEIVERHGGHIWVETKLNKGSTFTFALPERGPVATEDEPSVSVKKEIL